MDTYRSIAAYLTALLIFAGCALGAACAQQPGAPAFFAFSDLATETSEFPPSPSLDQVNATQYLAKEALPIETEFMLSPALIKDSKVQPPQQEKVPLTPKRKLRLAIINTIDPLNLVTAAAQSGMDTVTSEANSAYGTGGSAFAKRFGTTMTDEISGEFFQTFFFPSIFRQDPHYHRDVGAKTSSRILYAFSQVLITRSDAGHKTFNYGEVLGSFAAASVGNFYHVDRAKGFGPTSERVAVGIASDSAWNLFTEFWPDVTKHINFRMVFLRRLAEHAASPD